MNQLEKKQFIDAYKASLREFTYVCFVSIYECEYVFNDIIGVLCPIKSAKVLGSIPYVSINEQYVCLSA